MQAPAGRGIAGVARSQVSRRRLQSLCDIWCSLSSASGCSQSISLFSQSQLQMAIQGGHPLSQ